MHPDRRAASYEWYHARLALHRNTANQLKHPPLPEPKKGRKASSHAFGGLARSKTMRTSAPANPARRFLRKVIIREVRTTCVAAYISAQESSDCAHFGARDETVPVRVQRETNTAPISLLTGRVDEPRWHTPGTQALPADCTLRRSGSEGTKPMYRSRTRPIGCSSTPGLTSVEHGA